jgi:hypothetical protein
MQTRMAKDWELIESDINTINNGAQKQYVIAKDFLS